MSATLTRQTFRTSRELEYFTQKELTLQTGHDPGRWHLVIVKELVDNALDACEGAGILPEVCVQASADAISVTDNGAGLGRDLVQGVIDYTVRVSSKDAYISPTRGAQGNALKTLVAMPYVLSECERGQVEIISRGEWHTIDVSIDRIAQRPRINLHTAPDGIVKNGTRVSVKMANWACSKEDADAEFLQLIERYALFNPHATLTLELDGAVRRFERTAGECAKWLANAPTSAHWYTADQMRNLIAAYVAAEEYGAPARTVREFIAEFRGLSATAKQKAILERLNLAGVYLHDLVKGGDIDRVIVSTLLAAMRAQSKPIKPVQLGVIGEDHIKTWLEKRGAQLRTFQYKRIADLDDKTGLPFVVEIAFAVRGDRKPREIVTGINWAPTLANPFRQLAGYGVGLDGLLNELHINAGDPVTFVLHLACPHLPYTDRGKSSLEAL